VSGLGLASKHAALGGGRHENQRKVSERQVELETTIDGLYAAYVVPVKAAGHLHAPGALDRRDGVRE